MAKADAYNSLSQGGRTQIVMSGTSGEDLISKIFDLGEKWKKHSFKFFTFKKRI